MHLGLLQCGDTPAELDAVHGGYPQLYAALLGEGFTWSTWRVFEHERPRGPDAADGWLISGSKHGAYEPHDWIPPLEALIRGIAASDRPLVGICFGHQIVAQALGGRVENAGGWSVGRRAYAFDDETWHLNAWHQDHVTAPPPGARTIARSDATTHAGLAIGARVLTMQPHPEFSSDYIADLIAVRGSGIVPEPLLGTARAELALGVDNARMGARIARFFRTNHPDTEKRP